jgi:4-hydroxybenzoate decarboxylase
VIRPRADDIQSHLRIMMSVNIVKQKRRGFIPEPKDTPVKEQFFEFAKRYDAFPVPVKREETAPFHVSGSSRSREMTHALSK